MECILCLEMPKLSFTKSSWKAVISPQLTDEETSFESCNVFKVTQLGSHLRDWILYHTAHMILPRFNLVTLSLLRSPSSWGRNLMRHSSQPESEGQHNIRQWLIGPCPKSRLGKETTIKRQTLSGKMVAKYIMDTMVSTRVYQKEVSTSVKTCSLIERVAWRRHASGPVIFKLFNTDLLNKSIKLSAKKKKKIMPVVWLLLLKMNLAKRLT